MEDGAGRLVFRRDLTARGLTGVQLATSDAHAGLVAAIPRPIVVTPLHATATPIMIGASAGSRRAGSVLC